jgi:hypothetical protein
MTKIGKAFNATLGKVISKITLNDKNELVFDFTDGTGVKILDEAIYCCEERYMRTDDNLDDFIGAKLIGAELKPVENVDTSNESNEVHEIQFLEIQTNRGVFTMANHNENNGYYCGFDIRSEAINPSAIKRNV